MANDFEIAILTIPGSDKLRVHWVENVKMESAGLYIGVRPQNSCLSIKRFLFPKAKFESFDVLGLKNIDGEDLELPWSIIGLESKMLPHDRHLFVVSCEDVEFSFEANWPSLIQDD